MRRFGEKLRTLRKQQGLSYRELASQLDVSHGHIVGIEAGRHKPSADFILKIASLFNVSTDQLMWDDQGLD
ncbi:helix-turn-helix transcriptional regulator [Anaerolineales bacterium HSG6]|nr:helix-turn-helix transcriptional regulator [Anaerolineales bacterium HSG6]